MYKVSSGIEGQKRAINLSELVVEKKLDAPDSFRLRYVAQDKGKRIEHQAVKQGATVEFQIGWKKAHPLFKGEVSYIHASFGAESTSSLEIAGFDHLHRLTRGTISRTWGDGLNSDVNYSDVFSKIISDAKATEGSGSDNLTVGKADNEGASVMYVPQLNVNNFQFIKSLGADVDQSVDANSSDNDKEIKFRKIQVAQADFTVCYDKVSGSNAVRGDDVQFRISTVRQVAKVVVRSWDPKEKMNIIGEATSTTLDFGVTKGHEVAGKSHWGGSSSGKVYTVTDQPVSSKDEADAVAQSIFDQLAMDFVHGDAEIQGDASVTPGNTVEFTGYGDQFDGKYLVLEATHIYIPGVTSYITRFGFARNGANATVD
jgi:phage protein D